MATTKKPTGLKVSRSGKKLTCEWKIADSDYKDGQQFEFRAKDATHTGYWTVIDVGKTTTKKVISYDDITIAALPDGPGAYFLDTLKSIEFRVRGNRDSYTKSGKTVNPGWSDWSNKVYAFDVPNQPTISEEWNSSLVNQTTFSWETEISDSDNKPFYNVEWQSLLVKDCNTTNGSRVDFSRANAVVDTSNVNTFRSGTGKETGSQTFTEDTTLLASGSYTRWFRVRSYGWAGYSEWKYSYHTYSATRRAEVGEAGATPNENGNGYVVEIEWTADASSANPIDSVTVQYAIVNPVVSVTSKPINPVSGSDYVSSNYELTLAVPAGTSWNDASIVADTSGTDKIRFEVDNILTEDQVMFARVNTKHDEAITYGSPKLVQINNLSNPTLTSVETNDTTFRATVNATNNSAVSGSFLAVYFHSDTYKDGIMVGVIPSGSTSVTVQCPDWSDETYIAFSVKAMVGVYSYTTKSSGQRMFSLYSTLLQSNNIQQGGNVPQSPASVRVSPTSIQGTIRVEWDWNWAEADGAEISWSDHEDAWESTDAPDTYTITNLQPSHWNISGLETGVKWYIRVRLLKGSGDSITYGPWSSLDSSSVIDLASAPSKPVLVVSDGIITEDGNVVCSWVYSTTDGTDQAYAEIAVVTVSGSGNTYEPIVHTETAQHITINAKDVGWTAGQVYNLAVRVVSASGRVSDEWSDYVPVTVAEPLSCRISETSILSEVIADGGDPVEESVPYNFRITADDDGVGDQKLEEIVGGSLVWNQLQYINPNAAASINGLTITTDGNYLNFNGTANISTSSSIPPSSIGANITLTIGHVYLGRLKIKNKLSSTIEGFSFRNWESGVVFSLITTDSIYLIKGNNTHTNMSLKIGTVKDKEYDVSMRYELFDLTQMFGSTIADYIYSLEQANAGAGVAWFKKLFQKPYYEYNTGELLSVNAGEHRTTGFNQLKEMQNIDNASATYVDGVITSVKTDTRANLQFSIYAIRDNDYSYNVRVSLTTENCTGTGRKNITFSLPIGYDGIVFKHNGVSTDIFFAYTKDKNLIGGKAYCISFDLEANNPTISGGIKMSNFCINLYDPERNGQYEPYTENVYPLDSSKELRGLFYLDANNKLRANGDIYHSDGHIDRRFGIVDLGTLSWVYQSSTTLGQEVHFFLSGSLVNIMRGAHTNLLCTKYITIPATSGIGLTDKSITKDTGIGVYITDNSYTDAATFKAAMSGVYLVYELATPTVEQALSYSELMEVLPHYGTEQFVDAAYAAGDRDVQVPVGHNSQYAPEDGSIRRTRSLTELPFTVTAVGAGEGGTTTVAVERAENYNMDRPDEDTFNGFEGETILLRSQTGEDQMTFTEIDKLGSLDDGAKYRLVATVQDGLGQSSPPAELEFEVRWEHQAIVPTGSAVIDGSIAKITPTAPNGYQAGDKIDIYRLSADKPELIVEGADFGTTYVDPYPAIGEFGGHRLVYRTYNGDYTTEDGTLAWLDLDDTLDLDYNINIIDFGNRQIQFYYDTDYSSNWEKSFEKTEYLGGSVQGDWGSTVKRTGTLSSFVITTLDQDMIESLRRLAEYKGICHVRTADGSSFSAQINVSEDRTHTDMEMRATYSLDITKVDPEGLDGMTLEQWEYIAE